MFRVPMLLGGCLLFMYELGIDQMRNPALLMLGVAISGLVWMEMGIKTIPPPKPREKAVKPPDRESFHLMTAKICYVSGSLSLLEYEQSVEWVLKGGTLNEQGRIRLRDIQAFEDGLHDVSPFPNPKMETIFK